jgi:hypothetical protein
MRERARAPIGAPLRAPRTGPLRAPRTGPRMIGPRADRARYGPRAVIVTTRTNHFTGFYLTGPFRRVCLNSAGKQRQTTENGYAAFTICSGCSLSYRF